MSEQDGTGLEQGGPASASPHDNNSNRQGITMAVVSCLLLCIPLYCAFRVNRCVRVYMAGTHVRKKKGRF